MSKQSKWVSATEVAAYVYCPESWRLEHGLRLEASNKRERARGERTHERWQKTERRSLRVIVVAGIVFVLALILWVML